MAIRKYQTKEGMTRYQAQLWIGKTVGRSKSFSRKIDAERWLAEERLIEKHPQLRPKSLSHWSLNRFFHNQFTVNKRVSEGTLLDYQRLYRQYVATKLGDEEIGSITTHVWMNHLSSLVRQKLSTARANRLRTMLSSVYSLAIELEVLKENPIRRIPLYDEDYKVRATWTPQETRQFFQYLWKTKPRLWSLFQLAYETGMRMGEIQALSKDAVHIDAAKIDVLRTYSKHIGKIVNTTKGRKKRVVPVSGFLIEEICRVLSTSSNELIFSRADGRPLPQEEIRREFKRACKEAGVRRIPFHSLRHSFATHFLLQGGGTLELKTLLGHSRIETTQLYTHLTESHLAQQVSKIHLKNQPEIRAEC